MRTNRTGLRRKNQNCILYWINWINIDTKLGNAPKWNAPNWHRAKLKHAELGLRQNATRQTGTRQTDARQRETRQTGMTPVGHRVAQIKFDPFLDLLSFSMWLCATKMQKKHQQLSNLEIYSDKHYTNSLQQQSIVISHYADNYCWLYYDFLLLCLLFYY